MKAKSIKGNSTAEVKTALQQCMEDGYKPTLAFVFMSIKQDIDAVSKLLDQQGIQIFGATTGGEFIDGDIGAGTIAILLVDLNPAHFKVLLYDYRDKDPGTVVRQIAAEAKETFKNPSFIISVSVDVRGESGPVMEDSLINSIEFVTGKDIIIWGGRAGDDFAFKETVVFNHKLITKRGIIILVLDGDKILVRGAAASGQKPVGTEKIITKAIGKWVYEIDHQPAAEMVLKYLGLNLTQEEAETFYPKESIVFSVSRDKGDSVLRGLGVFDWKNKSFSSLGDIHEGDKIRLTIPPDFEVIEEVKKNAETIKEGERLDADALLMFSCIGRLGQFGPLVGEEIEAVRKVFNVPMAGFFTYGEFGRTKNGNNEFHANTCCWVTLKEK
ncbi:MAG: FIST N-terminal domain-containing protein [Cyclobacteriaceae bacterium]